MREMGDHVLPIYQELLRWLPGLHVVYKKHDVSGDYGSEYRTDDYNNEAICELGEARAECDMLDMMFTTDSLLKQQHKKQTGGNNPWVNRLVQKFSQLTPKNFSWSTRSFIHELIR